MTQSASRARRLLLEGLVIVASILLAFAIDAGWDERQEREAERRLLVALEAEFAGHHRIIGEAEAIHRRLGNANLALFDTLSAAPSGLAARQPAARLGDAVGIEYLIRAGPILDLAPQVLRQRRRADMDALQQPSLRRNQKRNQLNLIRSQTLIVNLPGSVKAAQENLEVLIPALKHALEKIQGDMSECASQ